MGTGEKVQGLALIYPIWTAWCRPAHLSWGLASWCLAGDLRFDLTQAACSQWASVFPSVR